MNKFFIYFLIVLLLFYFSFVTSRILSDIESHGEFDAYSGQYQEYSASNNSGSVLNYFNFSHGELNMSDDHEYVSEYQSSGSTYNSSGNYSSFSGFASTTSEEHMSFTGAGSPGSVSSTGKRNKSREENLNFGNYYSNPFGGLISQISRVKAAGMESGSENPKGTFGMKLGGIDVTENGLPVSNDQTLSAPLDSGVYFLLAACLIFASFYLYPKKSVGFVFAFKPARSISEPK